MSKVRLGLGFEPFTVNVKDLKRIFVNGRFCLEGELKRIREQEKSDVENNVWKDYCCMYNNRFVKVSTEVDENGDVEVILISTNSMDYVEKLESMS